MHPKFEIIESANLMNIYYDNNKLFYSDIKKTSPEIKVALDYVHWSKLIANNDDRDSNGKVNSNLSSFVIRKMSRDTIYSGTSNSKKKNEIDNYNDNNIIKSNDISALAFESPYARFAVNYLCQKTKAVLDIGAFNHSLIDYDIEEAYDALNFVSEHINFK